MCHHFHGAVYCKCQLYCTPMPAPMAVHDSAVAKNKIQHAGMRYALTPAAVLTSSTIQYSAVPL